MSSIYQRALGSDFARLHPEIQRRFGFCPADGIAAIGHGVMDEVTRTRKEIMATRITKIKTMG